MPFIKTKISQDLTPDQLRNDYIELKNLTHISKKYNVSKNTIIYYFKKFEIPYKNKIRNYDVEHTFFRDNNEEVFYWAGFLAADGCISIRKKFNNQNVILQLGEKDLEHLLKFKVAIKSMHPIKERIIKNSLLNNKWSDRKIYSITIGSHRIVADLKKFNIVSNKTKTYELPLWLINHSLVHHFLRGYFDGDGCFNQINSNRKTLQHSISIAGTQKCLSSMADIFKEKYQISNRNLSKGKKSNIYVLAYTGNKLALKIGNVLYNNANIFLDRKYKLWTEFNDYYNSRKHS